MTLILEQIGPAVSIQDNGRQGGLGLGLSRSGAADRAGYLAACALTGAPIGAAAIEMAGFGGRFRFDVICRFALTGARMRARLNGEPLDWNAAYMAMQGDVLEIGAAESGVYGYLLPGHGLLTTEELGGRGLHRIAGLGQILVAGDRLQFAPAPEAPPARLPHQSAASGPVRVMPGPQTELFSQDMRARFEATTFTRSPKANRQGVRLDQSGEPFSAGSQLQLVSDFISEGDIQMTGDGTPYVLLADCQTMGGYPRIGTVIPSDLPRIAQASAGETLSFSFVSPDEAQALWQSDETQLETLKKKIEPLIRDPRFMNDLLSYELISKPLGG